MDSHNNFENSWLYRGEIKHLLHKIMNSCHCGFLW